MFYVFILISLILIFLILIQLTTVFIVRIIKKVVLNNLSQSEKGNFNGNLKIDGDSEQDEAETDVIPVIKTAIANDPVTVVRLVRTWLVFDDIPICCSPKAKYADYTSRQKVAIFFIAIGSEYASDIFKHLREDEIETIIFEIARIEIVDFNQKDKILREFYYLINANQYVSTGGIDFAREILETTFGSQKAIDILNRLTSSLQVRPFDFIRRTNPAHLLNVIQQEHPQVIALILAYLEPNKASVILENLPHELQSDVTRRIAVMDRASPETLREIERVLEKKLSIDTDEYTAAGGVETVVEILNLVDRASEKQIIEALEDEDPELAEEVKKRMFVFEDIVMLDDRAIQKIMREVDSQELALSMKGVDFEVQDKIFKNMSKRAVGMLKEDMEYMEPVHLKDIEKAQQKIISIIRHLEDSGEITIFRAGEDKIV